MPERIAAVLCARRDVYDNHHEAQDVPCGPCWGLAAALLPVVAEIEEARVGANPCAAGCALMAEALGDGSLRARGTHE